MMPAQGHTQAYSLIFTRPEYFMYLMLLIPVALIFVLHFKRRFPVIAAFLAASHTVSAPLSHAAARIALRYLLSSLCFLLFVASLVVALAGPVMGSRLVREFRRGCDVVFAFDISRSMLVKDCMPPPGEGGGSWSRLDYARWIARNLMLASGERSYAPGITQSGAPLSVRYAVAFGKGRSVLALPVTSDTQSVLALIDTLSTDMISSRGTNLERLIDAASEGFLNNAPAARQIILFSDGESLSGTLNQAIERARLKDIIVFAVGIGSLSGALVPESATGAGQTQMVRSFLHTELLKTAVERRGGSYINGADADIIQMLREKIMPFEGDASWVFREEAGELWHIFVIAGIIFLGLSSLAGLRLKRVSYAGEFK